ncbi:hypothetical protein AVEN_180602-1 [Araneus ventricosus]|uniref:Uncharacterized protein n=1 Tax=Araneus ventricosus TaxID=182803 RepID=A0A4Y2MQT2_ARAVE|nr:hypothetical protein AVEN_180602-1 [Araneus ventricosus]
MLIYCFIARCTVHSTVLNVPHAGYSKKSWSDPETPERSRSFAIADENFITVGNAFLVFNFCGFNNGDTKTHPFAESEPPCSLMREGMYFLVYVSLSAVNTTSEL